MLEQGRFWRNKVLRDHVAVVEGNIAPTIVLTNGVYLNVHTKEWLQANIWIYHNRIVYVGDDMPQKITNDTEIVDCTGQYLVPGYIEPHSQPAQMFNPEAFAMYAGKHGTTTLINDNLQLLYLFEKSKAFTLIEELHQLPISMFWSGRYDSQSKLIDEEKLFNTNDVLRWMNHSSIVQGGELTAWPKLLDGDDRLLYWIQETKRLGKRVEGHLPGASEQTLTKLKLLGVGGEHEAITLDDVMNRLRLGYHVALRYSSIRPDLPTILSGILKKNLNVFDQLTYTTDSIPPSGTNGIINTCIQVAIEAGVPLVDAYRMGTYNVAKYYGLDEVVGSITPGSLAHVNILYDKTDPTPLSVIGKGKWIIRDGTGVKKEKMIPWADLGIQKQQFDWELTANDLQFSIPIGVKLTSDVLLEPFAINSDITTDILPNKSPDAFLLLLSKTGRWRVNTVIQGFTNQLGALCSSYSTTGDIINIGKNKSDMELAFHRMNEIGGGIVLVHEGNVLFELPLSLGGMMYDGTVEALEEQKEKLHQIVIESGYEFTDPIACLSFLSSIHLPYVRVTPQGIIDVKNQAVIVPANMR